MLIIGLLIAYGEALAFFFAICFAAYELVSYGISGSLQPGI